MIKAQFFLVCNIFVLLISNGALADSIHSYFNHNQNHSYTDPYYHRNRIGDNLEEVLLSAISSAQSTISIAVYELDLPFVAKALVAKKKLGVDVRVILENDNSRIWTPLSADEIAKLDEHALAKYNGFMAFADSDKDGNVSPKEQQDVDSLLILKTGGISWIDDASGGSKGSGLMHHKFMLVDGKILITGSANFTRSCIHGDSLHVNSKGNANSLLKIENKDIVDFLQGEFDQMYNSHFFGVKKNDRGPKEFEIDGSHLTIQFSPTSKKLGWDNSTNGLIAQQFAGAQISSDAALFVFSEQKIVDAMQAAHEKGMKARVLIDPGFATRYYSELLDILGIEMRSPACKVETDNNPWSHPSSDSGFTVLDEGDVLHHKFAVIDHKKVIVGSHNWSDTANDQNDEALLIIEDARIASEYTFEFQNLYKKSILGVPDWLRQKMADLDQQCSAKPRVSKTVSY